MSEWRGSGTILVVDDEEAIRNVMRRTLERAGFKVLTSADGPEGLKAYAEHRAEIRAIVLDVTMPTMSGEETLRRLRAIDPHVPVVLSSGYSEQEATKRFTDAGGPDAFVEKPFTPRQLVDRMRTVLSEM